MTTLADRSSAPRSRALVLAGIALVGGALGMAASTVFVRWAEVGPFVSAFWRAGLSIPFLWLWARLEARGAPAVPWSRPVILAGLFFAGDLVFWHLAILNTTLTNATLLGTLAPVWVALGSRLFIGEPVSRATFAGLALCVAGALLLVGSSLGLNPERVFGDICGVVTSLFFGAYFLSVRVARRTMGSGLVLYRSTLITAAVLLVVAAALDGHFLPASLAGAGALVALALVSQVGGQGLLAFALGHLSAAFSSLVIFLETVAAALFGYAFFNEAITGLQLLGGIAILSGIWIARPRRSGSA